MRAAAQGARRVSQVRVAAAEAGRRTDPPRRGTRARSFLHPPVLVAHADWSTSPAKRWLTVARRRASGGYEVSAPEPVGELASLLDRLRARAPAPGRPVLSGFDFPIGLPRAYAAVAGVGDFRALLPRLGRGRWREFYEPAAQPHEISPVRPFYPKRPGGARRAHLVAALGVDRFDDLHRACDRAEGRRIASTLFWTLGSQQAGRAALTGWREVIAPALAGDPDAAALWPFDGRLDRLLRRTRTVLVECYPGEYYRHLRIEGPTRKRQPRWRQRAGRAMRSWADEADVELSSDLTRMLDDGFGPEPSGEDPFDATVGCFGMLNALRGRDGVYEPDDVTVRRVEGWIFGQRPGRLD